MSDAYKCEQCGRGLSYAFVVYLGTQLDCRRYCTPTCAFRAGMAFGISETRKELAQLLQAQVSPSAGTGAPSETEATEQGTGRA